MIYVMTTPEQREKNNAYARAYRQRRIAADPGWRAKLAAYNREYRVRNPQETRKRNLLRLYALPLDEWQKMMTEQNECCAVCERKFEDTNSMRANVDHNHETGAVRGLVCPRCNAILGRVDRDVDLLERAIRYLRAK